MSAQSIETSWKSQLMLRKLHNMIRNTITQ